MLLIEESKIIDFKFKMLTLEQSTPMYRRGQILLLLIQQAGEEGQQHVGIPDCPGNGGRSNFDAIEK